MNSSWPVLTANGWFPALCGLSDGRVLAAYGQGQITVADCRSRRETFVAEGTRDQPVLAPHWIEPGLLTWMQSLDATHATRYIAREGDGWRPHPTADDPTLVAGNTFDARDGHWITELRQPGRVARDGVVLEATGGGLCATGGDGCAWTYGAEGLVLVRYDQGVRREYPALTGLHQLAMRGDVAVYGGYGPVRTLRPNGVDRDVTASPWPEFAAVPVWKGQELWIVSSVELPGGGMRVLLRPEGDLHVFAWPAVAATLDALYHEGAFWLATADGNGRLVIHHLTDPTPREPLGVPPYVEAFAQDVRAGYFFAYSDRYGDNPDAPQTCTVVVEPGAVARTEKKFVLGGYAREGNDPDWGAAVSDAKGKWARVLALWCAGADKEACAQDIARAEQAVKKRGLAAKPVIAYVDQAAPNGRYPSDAKYAGLQAYPAPGERLEALRDRVRDQLARIKQSRIALICGAYDRNGTYTDVGELARIQSLWPELAHAERRIRYLLWFSDGRPGGTRTHEQLRPWHQATIDAIKR